MVRKSGRSAKRNGSKRGLVLGVLIAGALALIVLQTAPGISDLVAPVRATAGDQLAAGSGLSDTSEPGLLARLTGQAAQERRIRELEARVRELSRYEAAARSMAQRLEAYESMLNAMGEPPLRGVTARVAAESDGPFSDTILVNAGRAQGVEAGWVAVNEGGLVGRVIRLGERSSRILMVTDFNSRVPVMGEQSGVRAILYGERAGVGALKDLPESDPFLEGERVLTSGEGGVFPRGILAGRAERKGGDWQVALALGETRGGFVRLLPPASIPKPEDEPPLTPETLAAAETGTRAE